MKTAIRRSEQGVTLVELMIAVTIGLLIMGIVTSLYMNMRGSFRYNEELSRMQESGRFSIEAISRDIRMAGYTGCGTVTDFANVINGGGSSPYLNFNTPIMGYEGGVSTFPADLKNSNNQVPSAGTDAVILMGVDTSNELIVQGHNPPSAQIDTSTHSIKPGEILLITDCSHAALFQMTGPTNNNNNASNVVHNTGTETPGNCTKYLGASCPSSKAYQFKPGASLLRVYSNAYFVAPSALDASRRSLWRKSLTTATATELIEGIENMQILFGVDTDGDRSANKFIAAGSVTAAEWPKVVAARVSLLVKSTNGNLASKTQTYSYEGGNVTASDKALYKTYTEMVVLRNRTP